MNNEERAPALEPEDMPLKKTGSEHDLPASASPASAAPEDAMACEQRIGEAGVDLRLGTERLPEADREDKSPSVLNAGEKPDAAEEAKRRANADEPLSSSVLSASRGGEMVQLIATKSLLVIKPQSFFFEEPLFP